VIKKGAAETILAFFRRTTACLDWSALLPVRPMRSPRKPNEDDRRLGFELRRARQLAGYSQADVAAALGVSTQQYGKYERGENRIAASRLETAILLFAKAKAPAPSGFS
jgi:DNA-binding XRE family transcriptional regulator